MNARRVCALLALPAAVVLAACTSSGKETPGSSNPAPSNAPTDAAGLSALVKSAVTDITSAHVEVGINLAAQELSGSGDEQLSAGKLVALDLTEQLSGVGDIRVIVADGKTYAKLPSSMNPSGKPYLLVSTNSSNPTIRQLAPYLDSVLSAVSPASFSVLAGAAKSVELKGSEPVDGVSTTHYSIQVEIAKLPATYPGKAELASGGVAVLPLELYLDSQGRPVKAIPHVTVQGQDVPISAQYSDYNKPVSIQAPPADQIGS
jgi:hypothetical protein